MIQFQTIYQRKFLDFFNRKKLKNIDYSAWIHLYTFTIYYIIVPVLAHLCILLEQRAKKEFFSGWQTDCIFIKENMCNTQVCTNRCSCCVVFHNDLLWLFIFVVMHSLSLPQKSTRHAFIS